MVDAMIIGGISGLVADVATHPMATVKTRMQVQGVSANKSQVLHYRNPIQASFHMYRNEGFLSFFKGVGAVIGGAPFASGFYFGGVELTKKFGNKYLLNNSNLNTTKNRATINFMSGVIGQLCGSLAWVPMDVIKERCQVEGQVKTVINYSNSRTALKGILKYEGIFGLYRAYFIHQFTWAPFNGVYWMIYQQCKDNFNDGNKLFENHKNLNFFVSSSIAGIISSFITSPLDLVKTRMQVMKSNPQLFDFTNPFDCAIKVWKREGLFAFFDGVTARVLWLTPRYCIAVSLFDVMKEQYSNYYKITMIENDQNIMDDNVSV